MPPTFNERSPHWAQAGKPPSTTGLRGLANAALVCVLSACAARISPLLARHHLLSPGKHAALSLLLWGACAASALQAVSIVHAWLASRRAQAQQAKLATSQRKLLGLPAATSKPPPPTQRKPHVPAAAATQAALTPISPPQRLPRTPYGPSYAGPGLAAGGDYRTPPSGASASIHRPSPHSVYSTGAVATPEQMRMYMESFTPVEGGAAASPTGGTPPSASPYGGMSRLGGGMGAASPFGPAGYSGADADEQPDMALAAAMPVGVEVPRYRPSWLPRAKAAGHQVAPDLLTASTEEEVDEFLWGVLRARREWMEVWTEHLREWFSAKVLRPLVAAVQTADEDVHRVLKKYGHTARLPPLASMVNGADSSSSGGAYGGGGGGSGGGGGRAGGEGGQQDVEAMLRHAQQYCQALGATANAAQAEDALELMAALLRYEQLLLLLRGRRPSDLLPPAPSGYIWRRVQTLAEGSCMPAYTWNGGGPWAGRAWSPDLPNDSMLALYLFSAFLAAPGWQFDSLDAAATEGGGVGGAGAARGMPLFLGSLKPRPPPQHSAVLAYRPERLGRGIDAILALHPAAGGGDAGAIAAPGGGTMFCFVAEGRLLALTGYNAMFHAVLAFLLYHSVKFNGAVGLHNLQDEALGLARVVEEPAPGSTVAPPTRVFGMWFPPCTRARGSS